MIGILTEKPSAGRNFAAALGGQKGNYNGEDYEIVSARGHLFEFAQPEKQVDKSLRSQYHSWEMKYLPWDESLFSWKREQKKNTEDILDNINSVLSKCDEIIIATDNDPTGEGELLAWEILDELALRPKKWSRMYFEDESVPSIQKAFKNRQTIQSMNTDRDYLKADYRSRFDFLTMQFTRIATKNGDGKSVLRQGRLKSAMVLIVGKQLDEIANYKRIPWYQNRFRDENGIVYTNPEEQKYDKKDDVPQDYHDSDVICDSKSICHTVPPKFLDLASLSARLASKGYRAKQVLDVYQKMYEAQIVSYPRTEDTTVTPEQFQELLPLADKIAGLAGVDTNLLTHREPRKTHVKTGGAHGANRPGPNVPDSLDELSKYDLPGTGGLAKSIYELLAKNYLASLAEDYEYESQKGHPKDYPDFKGVANIPKFPGWKAVFDSEETDENASETGLGTTASPFVYEGVPTKPQTPTMKWLMKQLEKRDVGTGATRTSIYADVTNANTNYPLLVERNGKLSMAPAGNMSYKLLPDTQIGDLTLTEQLQADMRDIADGKANPDELLHKVQQMVIDDKQTMMVNGDKMRQELGVHLMSSADYATGIWNGQNVKFKKFWSGHEFTDEEIQDLLDGKEITIMDVTGKNGKKFNVKGRLEENTYKGKKFVGFKSTGFLDANGNEQISKAESKDYCHGDFNGQHVDFKKVWSGHEFTDDEIHDLLDGKEISFTAKSKAGKEYTAKGTLAKQKFKGNEYWGFKLSMDNKKSRQSG